MHRPGQEGPHYSGIRRDIHEVNHVVVTHDPHVPIDHPDREQDHDHGRGEEKGVECIASVGTVSVGNVDASISFPCAAAERAARVAGSHDASAVYRPWVGMLQRSNPKVGMCAYVVRCQHVQLMLPRRLLQQKS
jgi:hypothetical protein